MFYGDVYQPEFYDDALMWEDAELLNVNTNLTNIDAVLSPLGSIDGPGTVNGYVTSQDGQSLSGVMVAIMDEEGNVESYEMTDNRGYFELEGLSNGNYTVMATKVEYQSETKSMVFNTSNGMQSSVNFTLNKLITDVEEKEDITPTKFELSQNYPNPFNPSTIISYSVPTSGYVSLKVYDILGNEVSELVSENKSPGNYSVEFNADDLSSGIYFYSLQSRNFNQVRKMMLIK